jgi:xanthine/CO dehydrogenase XdhC/CoxF family maturation factor
MTEGQLVFDLMEVVQPRVRLVIFGAGLDVLPVVSLAKKLGWHTSVVDTCARVSSLEHFQEADVVWLCRPEDVSTQVMVSECTAVVVMTHDYVHDQELLRHLLPLPLRYLWCLGSRHRAETPDEIALSIVSELEAVLSQDDDDVNGIIDVDTPQAFSAALSDLCVEGYLIAEDAEIRGRPQRIPC